MRTKTKFSGFPRVFASVSPLTKKLEDYGYEIGFYWNCCSLTIYVVKPVGSRFGQMVSNIQHWQIWSRNRVYHLFKSVSFTEKRLRWPETGIKDGPEEIQYLQRFPFNQNVRFEFSATASRECNSIF